MTKIIEKRNGEFFLILAENKPISFDVHADNIANAIYCSEINDYDLLQKDKKAYEKFSELLNSVILNDCVFLSRKKSKSDFAYATKLRILPANIKVEDIQNMMKIFHPLKINVLLGNPTFTINRQPCQIILFSAEGTCNDGVDWEVEMTGQENSQEVKFHWKCNCLGEKFEMSRKVSTWEKIENPKC